MIGFVVPIKPRKVSKDWTLDNLLLERTARSICSQTDQDFRLIIVYNDLPEINYTHFNIIFVYYPFPQVGSNEIEDMESYVIKYYNREYAEKMMDKSKKIYYGCKVAIEKGCNYIMSVDSDDLVSNKLAAVVNHPLNKNKAGWRIKKGFIYEEKSKFLVKKLDIQNINGSTHIIRQDLINIPDFSSNLFWNYNLFEAHGYTYYRIKDYHNELLDDIKFYGVIYIVHQNNYSDISRLTKALSFKNIIKKIIRGKYLSDSLRQEYSLYNI